MKRIFAQPPQRTGPVRFEAFLIPETIPDAQGQPHRVDDLMSRRRQNYQSISLLTGKKKIRWTRTYRSRDEEIQLAAMTVEDIESGLGITRQQARSLRTRLLVKLRHINAVNTSTTQETAHAQTPEQTIPKDR